ncbi:MAG: hypothetical protein R3A13_10110 [Bdellovibrionota bacterium]
MSQISWPINGIVVCLVYLNKKEAGSLGSLVTPKRGINLVHFIADYTLVIFTISHKLLTL